MPLTARRACWDAQENVRGKLDSVSRARMVEVVLGFIEAPRRQWLAEMGP